jgi:hypothetical protein
MLRRSPLRRGKALKRSTRLKPRRATPRRSGRVINTAYLAAVRTLPCYACSKPAPSEPDHQGSRPYGRKADDDTAVPMCGGPTGCHRMRTDGFLPDGFGGHRSWPVTDWSFANKEQMRAWCDVAIAATRAVVMPMLKGVE